MEEGGEDEVDACSTSPKHGAAPSPALPVFPCAPHAGSISRLHAFLSEEDAPKVYTLREIRHRYVMWKSSAALHVLGPQGMSLLIRLLGTLSVSVFGTPHRSIFTHSRALQMKQAAYAPHWDFVERICHDKRALRYSLTLSDRYWLMHVYLVRFHGQIHSDPLKAERSLSKAKKLYLTIHRYSNHPDIHVPYFRALLASPSRESAQDLVAHFVSLLVQGRCHSTAVGTFFQLVLHRGDDITVVSKQEVLRALAESLAVRADDDHSHDKASPVAADCVDTAVSSPSPSDINGLAAALTNAAFGPGPDFNSNGNVADRRIAHWAIEVASRVFNIDSDSANTVDLRWNCVILLALARTRSNEGRIGIAEESRNPVQQAAVVEWQTVCALAAMENLFQSAGELGASSFSETVIQGFTRIVRNEWRNWTSVHPTVAPPRSLYVTRLICASFLKLGGYLKDKALVGACREYAVAAGLWSVRMSQPSTEAGLQSLASEQLYSSLVCGTFFGRALVDLMVYATHVRILRGAVDTAILRYSRSDPEHAQELAAWSSNRDVVPTDWVVASVGVALARRGISSYLERYLDDAHLTSDLRSKVASAHLQMYTRHGRRFMHPGEVADVADRIFLLVGQLEDPKRLLARLQLALLILIRNQYSTKVVALVETVALRQPSLLSASFYTHLLSALLRHRRFKLAQCMLIHCLPKHPEMAQRWTALVLFRFYRAGASNLASRLATRTSFERASSAATLATLARAVRFQGRTPDAEGTLLLAPIGKTAEDPYVWRHTVNVLVRAGRLHAAKQFFGSVSERAVPEVRTSLVNTILHGYLLRRGSSNRQRLRSVVRVYKASTDQRRFVPDHVTVNILLKALLRSSTEVDGPTARRLFDALVRSGYPTGSPPSSRGGDGRGDTPSPGETAPFGSKGPAVTSIMLGEVEIPRIEAPLLFKQDVQPLYKTFITAFYQRGDVAAARKVVGILQALGAQEWSQSERFDKGNT